MKNLTTVFVIGSALLAQSLAFAGEYPGKLGASLSQDKAYANLFTQKAEQPLEFLAKAAIESVVSRCLTMPIQTLSNGGFQRAGALNNGCPSEIQVEHIAVAPSAGIVFNTAIEIATIATSGYNHRVTDAQGNSVNAFSTFYVVSGSCANRDCDSSDLAYFDALGNPIQSGYESEIGGGRDTDFVDVLGDMVSSLGIQLRTIQ
jgi:hypothetical protein